MALIEKLRGDRVERLIVCKDWNRTSYLLCTGQLLYRVSYFACEPD